MISCMKSVSYTHLDVYKRQKQTIFKGSGVAIITPMLEDGSVNYPVLKELLEQQIARCV